VSAIFVFSLACGISIYKTGSNADIYSCENNNLQNKAMYDDYFISVDQTLCSSSCPCYLSTNWDIYLKNSTFDQITYNTWIKQNDASVSSNGVVNFQNCTGNVINKQSADFSTKYSAQPLNFITNLQKMESFNSCTGFCQTSYIDNQSRSIKLQKLLFNDVNK
jgi:hypothetical protein